MSLEQYANFSNYSVASATIVLAIACLAYIAEWAFTRQVSNARRRTRKTEAALVTPGGDPVTEAAEANLADASAEDRRDAAARIGLSLTVLSFALLVIGVVTRSLATGELRPPWGNMYEFSMLGITAVLGMFLVMVKLAGVNWIGGIVTGFGVIVLGLSMLVYVPAGPLVPALDSYWLVIHVIAAMLAAGGFAIGAALSVLYLARSRAELRAGEAGTGDSERDGYIWRLPGAATMDRLAYRMHAFSFPLWTFGTLIAGPIWAHHAWGRAWGWDPKEIWAFITWVAYACYLHARATAGWKGRAAAIVALVAFATLIFNYVGVNLFISGEHSYAK